MQEGWDYMIVLKEDSMPTVWKEALALMKINPEDRLRCHWGNREQVYSWANGIEYEYMAEKVKKKEILNVVICYETWKEDHSRTIGGLFYYFCDELQDIKFIEALQLLIDALKTALREKLVLSKEAISEFLDYFMSCLPTFLKEKLALCSCES
jgi:hypothetical protein